MKDKKEQLEEYIISLGTDITLIDSLVNFLAVGVEDKFDVSNYDIANLVVVISKMIKTIKSKYEEIEHILEI